MTETAEQQDAMLTPEPWMLHDMEFATVVTAKKPGLFIALCDSASYSEEENTRHAEFIAAAPDTAAERDRLQKLITDFQEWCRVERAALGAVDGYDYDSGQEYGLRRAEIEILKRLKAHGPATEGGSET